MRVQRLFFRKVPYVIKKEVIIQSQDGFWTPNLQSQEGTSIFTLKEEKTQKMAHENRDLYKTEQPDPPGLTCFKCFTQ
jgi:hypothetical protein